MERDTPLGGGAVAVTDDLTATAVRDQREARDGAVWVRHATQWSLVGAPLRPGAQDLTATRLAASSWMARLHVSRPRVLVLGVTPELCSLARGLGGSLTAVDKSEAMIRHWAQHRQPDDRVHCSDWRAMPLDDASIDLVLADGSVNAVAFPDDYLHIGAELRRVMRGHGAVIIRCFTQLTSPEAVESVFDALQRGAVGSFHVLKWRLAMALQKDTRAGVAVHDVWAALIGRHPNLAGFAKQFGWPEDQVRTIEAYRGVSTRYTFPTLAEFRQVCQEMGMPVKTVTVPNYELGDRCPTVVLSLTERGRA